jgi:hypothetical protein
MAERLSPKQLLALQLYSDGVARSYYDREVHLTIVRTLAKRGYVLTFRSEDRSAPAGYRLMVRITSEGRAALRGST